MKRNVSRPFAVPLGIGLLLATPITPAIGGDLDPDTEFAVARANHGAIEQIADLRSSGDRAAADLIRAMIETPHAEWYTQGTPKSVKQDVRNDVNRAADKGTVPVLVAYNIPFRDCAQFSAGGNVIREAIEWPGFSFVDITSQCIENNGRRIGFASANEMLTFYRKTYKRAPKDATQLNAFEIGIVYPTEHPSLNGHGAADGERPEALPEQPAGPMVSATESPGEGGATAPEAATTVVERPAPTDDEKARKRAESQERAKLMAQLSPEVKMRVAQRELTLPQALAAAGLEIPEWLHTGASAPADAPVPPGDVEPSATGTDPRSESKPELDAQKAEAAAEGRELVGGSPGPDTQPVAPRTADDAKPASVSPPADPKEAKRAEAQRKLAIMQRLPSELKLRVAQREISLEDAMREAGIDSSEAEG